MLLAAFHSTQFKSVSTLYDDQYCNFNYTQRFVSGVSLVCQADIDISYVDTQCRIVDQGVDTCHWHNFTVHRQKLCLTL
jgi:hypothetical protein